MGNFCCVVCELDDFVDDDDRAFQRQHNQRKKQLKDQQEALSYGLIPGRKIPGKLLLESTRSENGMKPKIASEMVKR